MKRKKPNIGRDPTMGRVSFKTGRMRTRKDRERSRKDKYGRRALRNALIGA